MSCWNKEQLESMLEDVVNELNLSDKAIEKHGQLGTAPAELVRLVLEEKDLKMQAEIDVDHHCNKIQFESLKEKCKLLTKAKE